MRRTLERVIVPAIRIFAVLAALAAPAVAFDPYETVEGIVEAVSEDPGLWMIANRVVRVDATTRIAPPPDAPSPEYWVQKGTSVVVRAPGWTIDQAGAAGFRPAPVADAGPEIAVGRVVRVKVRPGREEPLVASEIQILPEQGQESRR